MDAVKNKMQSWLEIRPNSPHAIVIQRDEDLQIYFAKNKLWYIGDENELSSLYKQLEDKSQTFWGSVPTAGLEIKKSHSGLPKLIVNTITNIVIDNYNGIESKNTAEIEKWKEIAKDNKFDKLLWKILSETLFMGDGAIKLSFDKNISDYPIIEWYSGDKVDFNYKRGRLSELVFKTFFEKDNKKYLLKEFYGYGYVKYKLYCDDKEVSDLSIFEETKGLEDLSFDKSTMWAIPFMIDHNSKYEGRGASKFDGKYTSFDSLDEVISQWIEAIRLGRATKYIPDKFIPRDTRTGELVKPNAFDNQFIMTETDMSENGVTANNKIQVEQPDIPSDKYLQTYMTYLDLCLQGLISPSTLGIDTKKIQDANAQYERQMEKTTMYTRQGIIEALNEFIPKVINTVLKMQKQLLKQPIGEDIEVNVNFSEYDSPSFDNQIDTISKAKMNGIMSVETSVKELYGDSKDEEWITKEVARLKEEQGITVMPEPAINEDLDLE